jgi:restriction system protein
VRGSTIADLAEFGEEIENLFHLQTYNATIAKRLRDQEQAFRDKLLANIREGRTSLSGGGNGLEKLVKELLEIDGYTAKVLSKRRFMGFADADVEATRNDHLSHTKLLIQVKHHSGVEETWGAKQLLEIVNQHGEEFADYELVLITTADAPLDLVKLCNAKGIQLMQGPQVVEWVQDALPRLSPETRARLGVALMPTVAD